MIVTLTLRGEPSAPPTDLGFLLHRHPDRAQSFASTGGSAYVVYPEATPERCTAALLLEVDPVGSSARAGGGVGSRARASRSPST